MACSGHALAHMYVLILPPLLLQLKDQFGVSITQLGFLMTICSLLFGVMALPGGFLADKWSYKAVLTMFFIGTPAAACVVGSARSVLGLGIGLALLGLFGSLYHPSGLAMISHGVRERGKALGLHGMAGNLGLAFSPIIAGGLALRFSWRHAYYFLSLPGFIAGAVFLSMSRVVLRAGQPHTASSGDPAQNTSDQSTRRFTLWAIILLYGAMALTGFCYRGVVTMLPTYLVMKEKDRLNVYGYGTPGRLFFATMVYLVGMLGQYMGGHFSDRRRKTRLYLLFNAVSLPFIILVGLTPGMLVVPVAALFALFHFANQPVENSLIAHYTPSRLRSSSYGLKFFFTFGFGSFGAAFSGYVADYFGYNSVFLALGGVIFLIVLVVAFLNVAAREARIETSQ